MIVDAQEQAKFRACVFPTNGGKYLKEIWRPELRVVGVAVRGFQNGRVIRRNYLYICGPDLGKGPNVTIDVVNRTLVQLAQEGPLQGGFTLFMDNAPSENKCSAVSLASFAPDVVLNTVSVHVCRVSLRRFAPESAGSTPPVFIR